MVTHAEDPAVALKSLGETVAGEAGDDDVEGVLGVRSVRARIGQERERRSRMTRPWPKVGHPRHEVSGGVLGRKALDSRRAQRACRPPATVPTAPPCPDPLARSARSSRWALAQAGLDRSPGRREPRNQPFFSARPRGLDPLLVSPHCGRRTCPAWATMVLTPLSTGLRGSQARRRVDGQVAPLTRLCRNESFEPDRKRRNK
jgi:hypothetical protein